MKSISNKIWSPNVLRLIAILISLFSWLILFYNASTLNVWEDEVNGYFLSKKPLPILVELMFNNIHEDPPLFDLLLHFWIKIVGNDIWVLRMLPILFWTLAGVGVFFVGKRLADEKAAWGSVIMLAVMPYHWLCPASLRWYSLFACLAVWNFFFFLRLCHIQEDQEGEKDKIFKSKHRNFGLYVASGVGLWLTNYIAPVLFFSHLIIILFGTGERLKPLKTLVLAWLAIGFCYLPWLPVFLDQVGGSVGYHPIKDAIISLYVLVAGEFSLPFNYWISLPCGIFCLSLVCLLFFQIRRIRIPLTLVFVVLVFLVFAGVIWLKRMTIISPFVAICLGITLASPIVSITKQRWFRSCVLLTYMLVIVGSFYNMVTRDGWLSYRWLDPFADIVNLVQHHHPNALVLTNSNSVFFYFDEEIEPLSFWTKSDLLSSNQMKGQNPKVFDFPITSYQHPLYKVPEKDLEEKLQSAQEVIFIHTAAYGPFTLFRPVIENYLEGKGYEITKTDSFLEVNPNFVAHHPKYKGKMVDDPLNLKRIVVAYFSRSGM